MIRFTKELDPFFDLLDPKKCIYYGPGQSFDLIEKKKGGEAKITVKSTAFPCFYVPNADDFCRFLLLNEDAVTGRERVRRCADHMVFVYDPGTGRWSVHLFELTKSVSQSVWEEKVLVQFTGALIRACAVAGVLQIHGFLHLYLHCGFRNSAASANFAEKRRRLGKAAPSDWQNDSVILYAPFHGKEFQQILKNCPLQLDRDTGFAELESLEL